jgi:nicotinic acid mononucleotide adenylyltransferase
MHWKLARDAFLRPLVAVRGEQLAWDAGFFMDSDPEHQALDDVDWLCTPRPRGLRPGAQPGERRVVLLATGGFCPVHEGHIAMMQAARVAATHAGYTVVGGYLSPGHDEYVRLKCGVEAIPASVRLEQCAAAAAATDWLCVDPWESLHRRVAVNYTDVVARLRAYLRAHVDPRIDVLYVGGGDNARFAQAFQQDAGCIIVDRPGAEAEVAKWRARLPGNPRILWAAADHASASRELRGGPWVPATQRLVVRRDDERAVRTLGMDLRGFQEALFAELPRARVVEPLAGPARVATISLDPYTAAEHTLRISRLFALGGHQLLGHVPRPGSAPIEDQIAVIPDGEYTLVDDDRMSGGTLAAVMSMLPPRIRIARTEFVLEPGPEEDVLDSRDFLVGTDEGGLVVELPDGSMGRAPYLLPYVDPAARASVPDAVGFSRKIWEANARIFERTNLTVAALPAAWRRTFAAKSDQPLSELCAWHAQRLTI